LYVFVEIGRVCVCVPRVISYSVDASTASTQSKMNDSTAMRETQHTHTPGFIIREEDQCFFHEVSSSSSLVLFSLPTTVQQSNSSHFYFCRIYSISLTNGKRISSLGGRTQFKRLYTTCAVYTYV
jgi:hypothetical protein